MTDPNKQHPHELAHEVLQDPAMDQALDWLIALQCPAPGQQAEFEAWLAQDPLHVHAFGKAQAAWGDAPVHSAAVALASAAAAGTMAGCSSTTALGLSWRMASMT